MIEHCITALRLIKEEERYRNYIGDGLYAISNSLGNIVSGPMLMTKYSELGIPAKEDERTEAEIIDSIVGKLEAMG